MKLTNATIYDIIGAVNKFNNAKGKTAFILFRTLRKLNEEIKDCDEQKNKLIQKYGKEVEGGGNQTDPQNYAVSITNKSQTGATICIYNNENGVDKKLTVSWMAIIS